MQPARRSEVTDVFHGTVVADPYRWLEDADAAETKEWVAAQVARTGAFLAAIPARETITRRLTELWSYPRYSAPRVFGDRYLYSRNDGLQNQAVLYRQDGRDGAPQVLLDPNTLSDDGTAAITSQTYSHDGRLLVYGISRHGSDWQDLRILNVATAHDYPETLLWCRFACIAWLHDNAGFYYNRFPEPSTVPPEDENNYCRVYRHRLGTPQEDDVLIYERPDAKELDFYPIITEDGAYLMLEVHHGTDVNNGLYYRPVDSDGPFTCLVEVGEASFYFIDIVGSTFYARTDLRAPRGRIMAIDLRNPARDEWRELVPEGSGVIDVAVLSGGSLVVVTMHDAHHRVDRYSLDGAHLGEIALPALGSIGELSGRCSDPALFLAFTSFLHPTTILRYDGASGELAPFFPASSRFDPTGYETTQVFYRSKDGTRIPMFLTHRKGLSLNGDNPTLLYGYGGFNISITPSFAVAPLVWLEHGGIYAVASLRGGGEYGQEWHEAGILERKQNVFDDFIAAAEWLVEAGYTSRARLAIEGASNGGLLVAACMVQRPELYGAVLCHVPVIDMLRYHRFTVGRYWIGEYGDPDDDPAAFRFLYAYSPLHNVRPTAAYPPTLILTADTDDRVAPAHARKFAAALQVAQTDAAALQAARTEGALVLLRVETRAGHGLGKPVAKVIAEQSDALAFLFQTLGME